jgi:hypothetical protein
MRKERFIRRYAVFVAIACEEAVPHGEDLFESLFIWNS